METTDFFRGVLISLAALVSGAVAAGAWQAWRQRDLPLVPRMPAHVLLLFVLGYVALLAYLVIERWDSLGTGSLSAGAYFALFALVVNLAALVAIVHHGNMDAQGHVRLIEREYGIAVNDFKRALRLLYRLNLAHWKMSHPESPAPMSRYQDELPELPDAELDALIGGVLSTERTAR